MTRIMRIFADQIRVRPLHRCHPCSVSFRKHVKKINGTRMTLIMRIFADQIRVRPLHRCHPCPSVASVSSVCYSFSSSVHKFKKAVFYMCLTFSNLCVIYSIHFQIVIKTIGYDVINKRCMHRVAERVCRGSRRVASYSID